MKALLLLILILLSSCYESDTSACKEMCPLGVRVFEYKSYGFKIEVIETYSSLMLSSPDGIGKKKLCYCGYGEWV